MKAGVSTSPCAVIMTPRRASPSVWITRNAKGRTDMDVEQQSTSRVRRIESARTIANEPPRADDRCTELREHHRSVAIQRERARNTSQKRSIFYELLTN